MSTVKDKVYFFNFLQIRVDHLDKLILVKGKNETKVRGKNVKIKPLGQNPART